jgi:hypothetical protein
LFYNRRAIEVNLLTRGLAIVLVSSGLLGVSGCSGDNETEVQKLAKTAGDPGAAAAPKAPASTVPTATTSDGAFKQNSGNMPTDYPGQKK